MADTQLFQQITSKKNKKGGFSLVELLVVSALIIMFTSIVMVGFMSSSRNSRDKRREKDMSNLQNALELYYETYSSYPTAGSVTQLMSNAQFAEFVQSGNIQDPLNNGSYVYSVSSDSTSYELNYTTEVDQVQHTLSNVGGS